MPRLPKKSSLEKNQMTKSTKDTTGRDYLAPDKYLNIEEVQRLRRTVKKAADRARRRGSTRGLVNEMIIELMLESGLRAEEICHLQLRYLPTHHGKDEILVRKDKKLLRVVCVKAVLCGKLQAFIKRCRKGAKPGSPLFASEQGYRVLHTKVMRKGKWITTKEHTARLSYKSLYKKIKVIGRQAGIPHLHPHVFRHTYATHLLHVDHDLRTCQIQLGHSKPETTARYANVFDDDKRRQIERLYDDSGDSLAQ